MYRFYIDACELEQGALKKAIKTCRSLKVLFFGWAWFFDLDRLLKCCGFGFGCH